jgi:DnaJ-class molecular chaperone
MATNSESQADGAWDPSRFKNHGEEVQAMQEQMKAKLTERPYGLDRADCPACSGEGKIDGKRCEDCHGTGKELTRDDHLTVDDEDGEEPQAEGNYYSSERMAAVQRIGH